MQGILMSLLSMSLQRYLQILNILLLFDIDGSVYRAHSLKLGNFVWHFVCCCRSYGQLGAHNSFKIFHISCKKYLEKEC